MPSFTVRVIVCALSLGVVSLGTVSLNGCAPAAAPSRTARPSTTAPASLAPPPTSQAAREPQRAPQRSAEQAALARFPGATLVDTRLGVWHGLPFWHVYLTRPGDSAVTLVAVEPQHFRIVYTGLATPADHASDQSP